jgi:hypothetical protein
MVNPLRPGGHKGKLAKSPRYYRRGENNVSLRTASDKPCKKMWGKKIEERKAESLSFFLFLPHIFLPVVSKLRIGV